MNIIKNWGPPLRFRPSECAYGLKCLKEIMPLGCQHPSAAPRALTLPWALFLYYLIHESPTLHQRKQYFFVTKDHPPTTVTYFFVAWKILFNDFFKQNGNIVHSQWRRSNFFLQERQTCSLLLIWAYYVNFDLLK